jgi:hypothetical protein
VAAKKLKRFSVSEDGKTKIGAEAYGAARAKLRKERGKAEAGNCRCGQPGTAWGLKPKKGATIFVAPKADGFPSTLRFSRDPADYVILCVTHLGEAQKASGAKASKAAAK